MVNYKNQKHTLFPRLSRELKLKIQSSDNQLLEVLHVATEHSENSMESVISSFSVPDKTINTDLNEYLSRPVLIGTETWLEGDALHSTYTPFYDYFNHPSIKKRIDNYAFLKCNMHIKVVITASPFYYSAALVSWRPLANYGVCDTTTSASRALISQSQRPSFNIYPQQTVGGEMKLPYIYHKEYLDVTNLGDFTNMGVLYIDSFTVMQNANSVTGAGATVQVFAWASEVELSGPTVELALQSKDEYHVGPVSKPASAISSLAGQLSNWPIIGRFATATSIAAGAVANVASLFGFTNVPNIDNQAAFRPTTNPLIATTDIGTAVEKLTVDSKNELTIDNSAYSAGPSDPLSIKSLISRESYIGQFEWGADNVAGDLLYNSAVTPALYENQSYTYGSLLATGYKITNTPMSMVSQLFQYWRGDLKFRFVFICSQFHRGKVRILWDPLANVGSYPSAYTEVFSRVVDLSEEQDVSVIIPYNQATAFLPLPQYIRANTEMYNTDTVVTMPADSNGMLAVSVLNPQTSPVSSAYIQVLVYVSMVDGDFESPCELDKYLSPYALQSKDCSLTSPSTTQLFQTTNDDSHLNLVYMGEKIVSLRQLMRRSNFSIAMAPTSYYDGPTIINSLMSRMPLYPGFDTDGIHAAARSGETGSAPYNYCEYTTLNWVTQCFVGYRGSVIWNFNVTGVPDVTALQTSRSRDALTSANYISAVTTSPGSENYASWLALAYSMRSVMGATLTNGKIQTGLSFLAPYYSRFKFAVTTASARTLGLASMGTQTDSLQTRIIVQNSATNTGNQTSLHAYVGIGTDFDPVFFLNVPVIYYRAGLPSPAA